MKTVEDISRPDTSRGNWDSIIKPSDSIFDLKLQDVWQYRDLMWLFVRRDFVAQYKQTLLGPLWHFIQPVLTTIMFMLIFGKIAQIPTDGIEPLLFYMSGITIWNYFAACLTNTSSTFVANAGMFGKVYFPRLVIPLSIVISNIVRFLIQFLLLLFAMSWFYFKGAPHAFAFGLNWLCIPLLLVLMACIGLGCGIIISSLTTKYKDFTVLIGFAVQLLMYITPIVYPLSYLDNKSYKWIMNINPLTSIVEAFKYILFGRGTVEISSLLYSIGFMIVVVLAGVIIFNKVEKTFMDTV